MAVTQHASGTTGALTLDTETFLGTDPDTTAGAFQFMVEVSNMVRIDRLVIRLYEKVNDSGDTARILLEQVLTNEQQEDLWVSPCFLFLVGWRFSLEQTDGTGRTYQWSIRKAA
jgi:hypothetical protein